ncbi:hypothetical protein C8Q78DRAFT_49990 [Trametes maxima]|nr:hypothetical protein C8Q78DRAFT_49990 [Trametes maxima]
MIVLVWLSRAVGAGCAGLLRLVMFVHLNALIVTNLSALVPFNAPGDIRGVCVPMLSLASPGFVLRSVISVCVWKAGKRSAEHWLVLRCSVIVTGRVHS